jgi:hypothetical protein
MLLTQIHLVVVSAWLGLVAGESVLEQFGRNEASRRLVAVVHGWIDIFFEGPLVLAVLVTGCLLLARDWPANPLLLVKVGCGLIAVIANLVCIVVVNLRMKSTDDARVRTLAWYVKLTGLAIPFAVAALIIGLSGLPLH